MSASPTAPGWVVVTEAPIGEASYVGGTADLFEKDVLTISYEESGVITAVYQPDRWINCTVYGPDGYPNFWFVNETYRASLQPPVNGQGECIPASKGQ